MLPPLRRRTRLPRHTAPPRPLTASLRTLRLSLTLCPHRTTSRKQHTPRRRRLSTPPTCRLRSSTSSTELIVQVTLLLARSLKAEERAAPAVQRSLASDLDRSPRAKCISASDTVPHRSVSDPRTVRSVFLHLCVGELGYSQLRPSAAVPPIVNIVQMSPCRTHIAIPCRPQATAISTKPSVSNFIAFDVQLSSEESTRPSQQEEL